jgi:hypothetical protein
MQQHWHWTFFASILLWSKTNTAGKKVMDWNQIHAKQRAPTVQN